MNLFEFLCCVKGNQERVRHEAVIAVLTGYYSGYYTLNKRAKKPSKIIKQIVSKGHKVDRETEELTNAAIAQYTEREKRFEEFFSSKD